MDNSKQIKVGAIISYIAIFVNIAAMLIYTPWMRNQIGMSNYGLFTLANSFITMFLMDFGIGSSVARFVAKYRAENNLVAINRLLGLVYKIFLAIDCVILTVLVVLYFFVDSIYVGLTATELEQFRVLYIVIAGFSVISFPFTTLSGILNAYEKFIPLKLCDLFQKLLSIALIVTALLLNMGVTSIVFANAFSGVLFIIVKLIIIKKSTPVKVDFAVKDKELLKEIFSFSIWVMFLGIAQRLTYNIAPSILGIFANSTEIAIYSPASAIAGYFYTFATAINGLFLPTISRKIAEKKDNDILQLMIAVGRYQVVVLGLLLVGFISVGKEFMVLWMGEEFIPAYYCTIVLTLPTIFEYSQQIANTTILAKNKVKLQSIGLLVTSLINLLISSILSKLFGAVGVSLGICITAFLNLIYINIVYYRVLKINVFEFYKKCYLPIALPIVLSVMLTKLLFRLMPQMSWGMLVIKGVITVVIFGIMVLIFHLKREERSRILHIFRKKE